MKYLKYFKTEAEYTAYLQSENFILPNVTYTEDADSVFYHVVKTETGDYKMYGLEKKNISGLTYNVVDLGLPSGTLWSDRNVGASAPEDFGTYFAWGETEGYNCSIKYCTAAELCVVLQPVIGDEIILTPDNIDEILSSMLGIENNDFTAVGLGLGTEKCFSLDWSDYFDTTDGGETFNKYATNKLTVLETNDDAATVNMGSDWRMPTNAELDELRHNCTVIFVDLQSNEYSESEAEDGAISHYNLKGIKFTGHNGNSIFIPAAGFCDSSSVVNIKSYGFIPHNTLRYDKYCRGMLFSRNNIGIGGMTEENYRYMGLTVRGVCSK